MYSVSSFGQLLVEKTGHKRTLVRAVVKEVLAVVLCILTNYSYWFCKHENWAIYQAINITLHISQLNYR